MGTIQGNAKPALAKRRRERHPDDLTNEDHSVTDPRFTAAETDPRFSRVPKRAKKAVVDNRFKDKLKQNPGFRKSDTPVDRFGRPKRVQSLHASLRDVVGEDGESDSDSDDDIAVADGPTATSLLDNETESDDSDIAEFMGEEESEETEDIPRGKATKRLAVIGLDWTTTRAIDIYVCLDSFCPPGKSLKSVEVHPSKFGLERLAEEAKFGPQVIAKQDMKVVEDAKKQSVVDKQGKRDVSEEGREAPHEEVHDHDQEPESGEDMSESDDEGVEEKHWKEQAALRKYEEERLKYYYAIVEFEDMKAADAVYEQCDGVEYAQSGRAFDLRFIPDAMQIETTPRDRAESVPDGYTPPNVAPSSLNTSTVKLSWDADDPDRVILKKKAIGKQQLDEENLKAYLGSSSEDEEVKDSAADIEKKRNALLGPVENEAEDDPDMGMEITFEPGMLEKAEEIVKRKKAKDERQGETDWEARLRRLQERKAEKRKKRKEEREAFKANGDTPSRSDRDGADDDEKNIDSSGFSDPFFSKERNIEDEARRIKSKRLGANRRIASLDEGETNDSKDAKEVARKRAELELLVMKDAGRNAKETGSMRDMLAAVESDDDDDRVRSRGRKRSGGRRRGRRDKSEDDATDPSTMDVNDPRFQGLFESHLFAMDPTHPKFKENETTQRILKEKMRRTKQNTGTQGRTNRGANNDASEPSQRQEERVEKSNTSNSELRQLAARLKARAKASGRKTRNR